MIAKYNARVTQIEGTFPTDLRVTLKVYAETFTVLWPADLAAPMPGRDAIITIDIPARLP